ncbi:MAG: hypothetical protein EON47_19835 [Acetobacteraceae bacterium]|nr:MAG: hypothetical protein EON47_19835 [Acetobacteraceae bacterium]
MPRLSLAAIIPPLLFAVMLGLAYHQRTATPDHPPPPTTAATHEASGDTGGGGGSRPAQPAAGNAQVPPG